MRSVDVVRVKPFNRLPNFAMVSDESFCEKVSSKIHFGPFHNRNRLLHDS